MMPSASLPLKTAGLRSRARSERRARRTYDPPASPALRLPARKEEPHLARIPPPLATFPAGSLEALLAPSSLSRRGSRKHLCSRQPGPLGARWSPALGASLAGPHPPPRPARPGLGVKAVAGICAPLSEGRRTWKAAGLPGESAMAYWGGRLDQRRPDRGASLEALRDGDTRDGGGGDAGGREWGSGRTSSGAVGVTSVPRKQPWPPLQRLSPNLPCFPLVAPLLSAGLEAEGGQVPAF